MAKTQAQTDGYVECGECGHAIEAHDANGCVSCGGECACAESWTEREIRRTRIREGLSGSYDPTDIS